MISEYAGWITGNFRLLYKFPFPPGLVFAGKITSPELTLTGLRSSAG